MKNSMIFWGIFLICLGIVFLLMEFGMFDHNFGYIGNFWPLLLVIWGISLLKIPTLVKRILIGLTAAILAFMIGAFFVNGWHFVHGFRHELSDRDDKNYSGQEIHENITVPYRNSSAAKLVIEAGAGEIHFAGPTENLLDIGYYGNKGAVQLETDSVNNIYTFDMNKNYGKAFFKSGKFERSSEIKLNTKVLWDMDIDIGAFDFESDLKDFMIRRIDLSAGASNVEMTLGDKADTTTFDISAGASSVTINIPLNAGCEILSETGLSDTDFLGFKEENDNVYRTENFKSSKQKIYINISGGVSSFEVNRY